MSLEINQISEKTHIYNIYDMGGAHSVPNPRSLEEFEENVYNALDDNGWPKTEINLVGWTNTAQGVVRGYLDTLGFKSHVVQELGNNGGPYLMCHTIEHGKLKEYFSKEKIEKWEEARRKRVEEARIAAENARKKAEERQKKIDEYVERVRERNIADGRKPNELRVGDIAYYNEPRLYTDEIYTILEVKNDIVTRIQPGGRGTWGTKHFIRIPERTPEWLFE